MAKPHEQAQAIILRKKGYSVGSIAKKLLISKSTASFWCRDISLSSKQIQEIAEKSKHHATLNLLKSSEKQREIRQHNIEIATKKGSLEVGRLSVRDIHMVGLGLYWGEGYKKGSQELGFTNSDPSMIKFYIEWLNVAYKIPKKDLILRVSINSQHINRVKVVEQYWSSITKIPLTQFTKTSLIKVHSKKTYENSEIHYGTLRIKVRRGTDLRRRILGSIGALVIT